MLRGGRADESPKPPPKPKRFVGIELGPGILSAIQRKVRIADWSQAEIDAYHEVLDFATKTPYAKQKERAEFHLQNEIQKFREDLREKVRKRIENYDALARKHPDRASRYDRLKKATQRQLEKTLRDLDENPSKFPVMARMTKSMIEDRPSRFHGRLITLRGQVRRLISYDAHKNDFGVKRLYEAWMFTEDSGMLRSKPKDGDEAAGKKTLGKIPVVIVFTSKPEGMPEGEKILESATVTGYVFRVHRYADRRDTLPPAPMILASRIEWHPRPAKAPTPAWAYAVATVVVAGFMFVIYLLYQRDRFSRLRRREQNLGDPPTDFSEVSST